MPWREDPAAVRPMLASTEEPPVVQRGLVYEPKYDGMRALVDVRPPEKRGATPHVALYSRNGHDKRAQFPEIVTALEALGHALDGPILADGEIVAIDDDGRPLGFQNLQGRIHLTARPDIQRAAIDQPTVLILFDLLRDADDDLRGEPLALRRLRLHERVFPNGKLRAKPRSAAAKGVIRLSDLVADDGREMLARAREERWEGLIVKHGHSRYQCGKRTPAWRKMKLLRQQELVVGGWTEPRLSRAHFGALLVGYYDEAGALQWAGSVGTGFDQAELDRVAKLLRAREIDTSPFAGPVKTLERTHWVKPDLVAEVRFTEWTDDDLLRHPVYLGLRSDKKARDVRREEAKIASARAIVKGPRPWDRRSERHAKEAAAAPRTVSTPARPEAPAANSRKASAPDAGPASALRAVIDKLSMLEDARRDGEIVLPNGDALRVTNLAKLFWSDLKITKGELIRYYVEVSPLVLAAVADRPLVMKRFPNGVDTHAFYQQKHPEAVPPGVRREVLAPEIDPPDESGPRDRLIGGSITTLIYMTQLAAISQDPWFSRVSDPLHMDHAAIDLDPGEGAGFDRVLDVARWVKEELDHYGIPGVPKTSGSRGLHIYIPLPKRTTYETGQLLCQMIAAAVADKHPKIATVERMVKRRPRATVYVDYLQNILGKTLATAYSARASDYAGVSTPLTWAEITPGLNPRDFTIRTAPARFRAVGDLWAPIRTGKPVDLKAVLRKSR